MPDIGNYRLIFSLKGVQVYHKKCWKLGNPSQPLWKWVSSSFLAPNEKERVPFPYCFKAGKVITGVKTLGQCNYES